MTDTASQHTSAGSGHTGRSRVSLSTMQDDFPLTIRMLLDHGRSVYGRSEVLTWAGDHARRSTFAEVADNAERLAAALSRLGIGRGDRVGTFMWNSQEHLEAYYAVPCMGAVLHTLNIRLPGNQLVEIIEAGADRVLLVDDTLIPLLAPVADQLDTIEAFVVIGAGDASALDGRPVYRYADLLAAEDTGYGWPEVDERDAAAMCFTSGTTGSPKGVVYSHRSTVLHAMAGGLATALGSTEADACLTFVPMFHVNAWGIPYGAFLSGSALHLPGPHMGAEAIAAFIAAERSTMLVGVPTIWADLHALSGLQQIDLSSLNRGVSGGAAIPRSLVEVYGRDHGVRIIQGWGMTETSPLGGMAHPPAEVAPGTAEEMDWRLHAGRVIAGVEMRICDDSGDVLPNDGDSAGEIEVRGPWITGSYFGADAPEKFHDGWLRTGDIGTLDGRGFFRITDRTKDVIKSGGEWISSVELENLLAAADAVAEAAVIAIPDPKWTERPLACVVAAEGSDSSPESLARSLADFLDGKVAKWQVPENWAFIDAVPRTSVGKFDKKLLRGRHERGEFTVHRLTR